MRLFFNIRVKIENLCNFFFGKYDRPQFLVLRTLGASLYKKYIIAQNQNQRYSLSAVCIFLFAIYYSRFSIPLCIAPNSIIHYIPLSITDKVVV